MLSLGDQTRTQRRQALESPRLQSMILSVTAGLLVFLGAVTRAPERFLWDAATYWRGSVSLAHGSDPYVVGALSLRGVLTSLLYFPAALADRGFGDSSGGVAVLVENSLLISLVCVLLLPWLLRAWVPVTSWMVWVCAGLTWLVLGRSAPYPLTDLWAAALMLAAVREVHDGLRHQGHEHARGEPQPREPSMQGHDCQSEQQGEQVRRPDVERDPGQQSCAHQCHRTASPQDNHGGKHQGRCPEVSKRVGRRATQHEPREARAHPHHPRRDRNPRPQQPRQKQNTDERDEQTVLDEHRHSARRVTEAPVSQRGRKVQQRRQYSAKAQCADHVGVAPVSEPDRSPPIGRSVPEKPFRRPGDRAEEHQQAGRHRQDHALQPRTFQGLPPLRSRLIPERQHQFPLLPCGSAEGVGFEPTVGMIPQRFSRPPH